MEGGDKVLRGRQRDRNQDFGGVAVFSLVVLGGCQDACAERVVGDVGRAI